MSDVLTYSSSDSTNSREELRKELLKEQGMTFGRNQRYRIEWENSGKSDVINGIFTCFDMLKFGKSPTSDSYLADSQYLTVKVEFAVGYPQKPPNILFVTPPRFEEKLRHDKMFTDRTARKKPCIDTLRRMMDKLLEEQRNWEIQPLQNVLNKCLSVYSQHNRVQLRRNKSENMTSPPSNPKEIEYRRKHSENQDKQGTSRNISFPARCGACWHPTGICVFVNSPIGWKEPWQDAKANGRKLNYKVFLQLAMEPSTGWVK